MPAAEAPLAGRKLYFVGIGGSGMSAYANIAPRARGGGARLGSARHDLHGLARGDRGRHRRRAGAAGGVGGGRLDRAPAAHRGHAPGRVPGGARRRAAGDRGRRCPRQDDDRGDDRLRAPGDRPRSGVDHRRDRAAARRQRRASAAAGSWSRATSPTARSARCARRSPWSPTSSSTITRPTLPRPSSAPSSTTGSRTFRTSSAAGSCRPVELELAVPGEHNRQNAAAALAALELAGVPRAEAEAAIARFTGVGRRLELVGERGGVTVYDDYGHNPTELEVTLRTARSLTSGRRDRRLPAARRRADAPAAPGARARRSASPTSRS